MLGIQWSLALSGYVQTSVWLNLSMRLKFPLTWARAGGNVHSISWHILSFHLRGENPTWCNKLVPHRIYKWLAYLSNFVEFAFTAGTDCTLDQKSYLSNPYLCSHSHFTFWSCLHKPLFRVCLSRGDLWRIRFAFWMWNTSVHLH